MAECVFIVILLFRQREILWNFFFPLDYQGLKVTKPQKPGEQRMAPELKISALFEHGADFDFLFSKQSGIGALQINYAEVVLLSSCQQGQLNFLDSSLAMKRSGAEFLFRYIVGNLWKALCSIYPGMIAALGKEMLC